MAGEANYRLMTEATGQRIAAALESLVNLGDPVTIAHGGTGASTATAALAALGGVAVTDIVNNLTSTATDKPLSANMGKTLEEHIQQSTAFESTATTGLTAASNVTINLQRYLTVGSLKVYNLIFTVNATFARDTTLISGFVVGIMTQNGVPTVIALNNSSTATHVLYLSNGELRSNDTISNGEQLRCTLVYTA